MEKEWIPVVATLLGVIVGGLITSVVKVIELRHQKNQAILGKLELLHEAVFELDKANFEYTNVVLRLEDQTLTAEQVHQTTIILIEPISKINTLISFYSPHLESIKEDLFNELSKLQKYGLSILVDKKGDLEEFQKIFSAVSRKSLILLKNIQKQSTRYTGIENLRLNK